jgi:hypothetical protein
MAQRHLDDRESDAHPRGADGHRAGERDGVAVDGLTGEVVLGEPYPVEAGRLREDRLIEEILDRRVIVLGRG